MSRLPQIDPGSPNEPSAALLAKVQQQLGRVPNLYRTMANGPAALEGYLAFRAALVAGKLSLKLREQIALLVAAENGCDYCVAAHSFRGQKVGLAADELLQNRRGSAADPKTAAALRFVRQVMKYRGDIADAELRAVHEAGWSDEELAEMVGHISLNVYSNFFNHLARPELDFPQAPPPAPPKPVSYGASEAASPARLEIESAHDFDETLAQLRAAIEREGLWLLQEVDPKRLLAREGFQIPRARQLFFFHPQYMAQLLEANPAAVPDVPLKIVVLERPEGGVMVLHDDVRSTLGKHARLAPLSEALAPICERILGAIKG